jgi:glycerophosphoryl diester phosphodiesterase
MEQRFPLITAHSGCMNTLDNTLQSVKTGLGLGADAVEEDIRVTKDGVPVLAHDDEWHSTAGRECRISQLTWEEIGELRFNAGREGRRGTMRICKLEEMLPLILSSGKIANLDLKADETIEPVAALVKKYDLQEQVILSGCERDRAMKAQRSHPELKKLLNADIRLYMTADYTDAAAQTCRDAAEASCFGININYRLVRPELLDQSAARGLPVFVWTVDEEDEMKRFADMGAASITARNVEALVRLKQQTMAQHEMKKGNRQ